MIKFYALLVILVSLIVLMSEFIAILPKAYAATTPSLGAATSFGILASTFTRNVGLTAISGDLGYTTLSGSGSHSVTGTTHVADGTYSTAGTDQGNALTALNTQTCDFNFGSTTDLSLLSQPLTPGVYCITAAASIGTGGITLNGAGTYIFRITGAFTTVDNSVVSLTGGASTCDVFWTPTSATTLGANSTFEGTVIDSAGITVGSTVAWTGRALAFGGTVTTDTDTIAVPSCTTPTATPTPTSSPTPTSTSSPTPTPTTSSNSQPNTGGQGDGLSDGRSDGRSDGGVSSIGGIEAVNSPSFPNTNNSLVPGFPNTGNSLIPGFPNTGINPYSKSIPWNIVILTTVVLVISTSAVLVIRKNTS